MQEDTLGRPELTLFTRRELLEGLRLGSIQAIETDAEYIKHNLWKITGVGYIKQSEDIRAVLSEHAKLVTALSRIHANWDKVRLLKHEITKELR